MSRITSVIFLGNLSREILNELEQLLTEITHASEPVKLKLLDLDGKTSGGKVFLSDICVFSENYLDINALDKGIDKIKENVKLRLQSDDVDLIHFFKTEDSYWIG